MMNIQQLRNQVQDSYNTYKNNQMTLDILETVLKYRGTNQRVVIPSGINSQFTEFSRVTFGADPVQIAKSLGLNITGPVMMYFTVYYDPLEDNFKMSANDPNVHVPVTTTEDFTNEEDTGTFQWPAYVIL